jgi:DNA replication initiation complex subunit (GINS family)
LLAEFQQEITNYDNITGYSDILRGISNPLETATAVEHKSQFAVHRHQNLQEDMQRFCRDAYRLIIDMAFSNFSDERLFEVLEPSLSPEERQQFDQILDALKRDWRRSLLVNIELHSTIMLSEDIHKQQAMELAQTLTGMLKEVDRF